MLLEHLVKEWLRLDPNEKTRREVQGLWDRQDIDELEKRMRTRIEFGTAGLRGRMEAGWARMNDLIIIQASQGLCAYVLKNVANAASRGVVIGHDHRHNSKEWARLTAAIFISYDIRVYPLRGLVHTPLVPFSMKRLNAACGVMVTGIDRHPYLGLSIITSFSLEEDNGFKVYWENAVQIIGPHDTGIAQAILDNLEPRINVEFDVYASSLCLDRTDEMRESYFALINAMANPKSRVNPSLVKFVNTSMHGVSDAVASEVFRRASFEPYIAAEEQRVPDPDFPTEQAIFTATQAGADYVLAQDPDADRFSAAERGTDGVFKTFTGDQLGTLFASRVLETYKTSGKPLDKLAMVASTVSSKMIEAMAHSEGFKFVDCLTGFKFIGNTALELVQAGYEVPFAYEEAIGFMFGSEIRDKDGIAATLMFAELATELRRQGLTVHEHLTGLYQKYVYAVVLLIRKFMATFQTRNSYFICSDPVKVDRIFAGLRSFEQTRHPSTQQYPSSIAELTVTSVVDLTAQHGYDSNNAPTYVPRLPLSSGHMIQFRAQSADVTVVLTIRTSGTEPKIKYYLEGCGRNPQKVSAVLPRVVDHLASEWMKASENSLGRP
ncbi:Phosphoglucomutase, first 3 domain-containing protein [Gyrodon lividus]|nr:Phosphoglucomutase, first 3 domain-containing protein [Gyrodon lividus]